MFSASVSSFICYFFLIPQKQFFKEDVPKFASKLEMPSSNLSAGQASSFTQVLKCSSPEKPSFIP